MFSIMTVHDILEQRNENTTPTVNFDSDKSPSLRLFSDIEDRLPNGVSREQSTQVVGVHSFRMNNQKELLAIVR
jgi:hypothetical protein